MARISIPRNLFLRSICLLSPLTIQSGFAFHRSIEDGAVDKDSRTPERANNASNSAPCQHAGEDFAVHITAAEYRAHLVPAPAVVLQ